MVSCQMQWALLKCIIIITDEQGNVCTTVTTPMLAQWWGNFANVHYSSASIII